MLSLGLMRDKGTSSLFSDNLPAAMSVSSFFVLVYLSAEPSHTSGAQKMSIVQI
ncbi:hypothetical protein OH77DRAFT_1419900 [Trametes cingulata]|nr:hypothetical protein OH77DRAFT_1419900 [Trametes cingulata]